MGDVSMSSVLKRKKGENQQKRKKEKCRSVCIAQGRAVLGIGSGDDLPGRLITHPFQYVTVRQATCILQTGIAHTITQGC